MQDKLKKWFYYVNANKYKHYFEEWFSNLTSAQLRGMKCTFEIFRYF